MQTAFKPKRKNMIWGIHDDELMEGFVLDPKTGLPMPEKPQEKENGITKDNRS